MKDEPRTSGVCFYVYHRMNRYAIIVAAGSGMRMGAPIPKQFLEIGGMPILMHTLNRFMAYDAAIHLVVVLHADYVQLWQSLCAKHHFSTPHTIVIGGSERFFSVQKAIQSLSDEEDAVVGIHDAVRPMVSMDTLERCYSRASEKGNAVPAIVVNDSMRIVEPDGNKSIDRSSLRIIQTPQCFRLRLLRRAFLQDYRAEFTDDASVVEALGERIELVEGNRENIKITTPEDLRWLSLLLTGESA
jgi:2-C-methyl-D-erythritol 4-phosphate cytidylyltransferase